MTQPARPTVIAINLTSSNVFLDDLGLTVPGSGTLTLNLYAYLNEIQASKALYDAINANQLLISDGTTTFTKAQSFNVVTPVASPASLNAAGLDATTHETLNQLVHLAESGGPFEGFSGAERVVVGGLFYTNVIWYQDSSHSKKIVEKVVDRTNPVFPAQVQWKAYAADGTTVVATATDAITYSGAAETLRVRTVS